MMVSHAATIAVSAVDADTLNTNSSCSLREAITNINAGGDTWSDCTADVSVNAYGTSDTITIPAGTYTTTIAGTGEDLNATGDYDILKSVAIIGAGASTTIIHGGNIDRVFHVIGATVSFSGVTITGGNTASSGGGISSDLSGLTITNATISGNTASLGGGILNHGTLTITNATISGNTATVGDGGGIHNQGTLTITNATISGNTASLGGGIYSYGSLTITNSIVANQTAGADCGSFILPITSNGHNLESATSCGFAGTGDLQNTNPLLGALADNGGPTQTMALSVGSLAIDAGDNAVCAASPVNNVDQRGIVRPQGSTCDIGAYEYGAVAAAVGIPTMSEWAQIGMAALLAGGGLVALRKRSTV
jgi:hypothetical protein